MSGDTNHISGSRKNTWRKYQSECEQTRLYYHQKCSIRRL